MISTDVKTSIEGANDEDANYLLLEHLEKNTTVDTLREYCKVAIAADGFPRMQALGRKMMEALPLGGWLVHGVGWVGTYLHTTHACMPLSHCVLYMHFYKAILYKYTSAQLLQFLCFHFLLH